MLRCTSALILLLPPAVKSSISASVLLPLAAMHAQAKRVPCLTDEVMCFEPGAVPFLTWCIFEDYLPTPPTPL